MYGYYSIASIFIDLHLQHAVLLGHAHYNINDNCHIKKARICLTIQSYMQGSIQVLLMASEVEINTHINKQQLHSYQKHTNL